MTMIDVRLFELACKGDRLDEINAEAVLDRRAAAHAAAQRRRCAIRRWGRRVMTWVTPPAQVITAVRSTLSGRAMKPTR